MSISDNYNIVNGFLDTILTDLKSRGVDIGIAGEKGAWNFHIKDYAAMKAFESRDGVTNWFDLTVEQQKQIHAVIKNNMPEFVDKDEYACAVDLLLYAMRTPDAVQPSTKLGEKDDPSNYDRKVRGQDLGYTVSHLSSTIDDGERVKPLVAACTEGNAEEVKKILEKDKYLNVNFGVKGGRTPLYWAASGGHTEVVKALLTRDTEGNKLPKVDVNKATDDGFTPLHSAAYNGHTAVVETLLENKAEVDKADKYGWTPLHWAARNGHSAVVETLLANGAEVNNDGWTPLHSAAREGHSAVVKTLLASGADVNKADKDGSTPLHWAARNGHTAVVKTLLEKGADVNIADKNGTTPLSLACSQCESAKSKDDKQKYFPIIYMLEQRAENKKISLNDPLLTQYNKWKTSDDAKAYDTEQSKRQRLEQEKTAREAAFKTAVNDAKWDKVRELLTQHRELATLEFEYQYGGPDRKRKNNTVLHVAAFAGDKETVEQILATNQGKTTLNMTNSHGSSPLHMATFNGKKEVVEILLANGADVNKADGNGNTSLHVGIATGQKEIAETLMACEDVDLTLKNKEDMTAHDLVIEQGQEEQTALQKKEGDANAHQEELKKLSELHQAFSKKERTLSRYQKTTVRSYTDASKNLDAETKRVSEEAKKYEATLATYYDDPEKSPPLRLRIEALRNKDNTSGKMNSKMRDKAKANLKKIYEAQGYPTDRAELQAQIMLGKLVRANLLYHPDERVKIDGQKSQTVTGLLIPQGDKYKGMTHRTILHDLATTDVADTEKYVAPLNNIEDAVSFSGYALKKPKDKGTDRRMSYNPKKGITAGYRTEETLVDKKNKTEANGLMARLSSAQQSEAPENPAQKQETSSQSSDIRTYSDAYKERAETEHRTRWEQLAGQKSRVRQFKGQKEKNKKAVEIALSNIEKILEANGYTDKKQRETNAKIILTKLERAALESGGSPFGFDHRQLLMDLVSGAVERDKYSEYFKNISTVEERVRLGDATSILKQNAKSTTDGKEFNEAGFKKMQKIIVPVV